MVFSWIFVHGVHEYCWNTGVAGLAGAGLGMRKETSAFPMEGRLQARTNVRLQCTDVRKRTSNKEPLDSDQLDMVQSCLTHGTDLDATWLAFKKPSVVLTRKNTKKIKKIKSTTDMGELCSFLFA